MLVATDAECEELLIPVFPWCYSQTVAEMVNLKLTVVAGCRALLAQETISRENFLSTSIPLRSLQKFCVVRSHFGRTVLLALAAFSRIAV